MKNLFWINLLLVMAALLPLCLIRSSSQNFKYPSKHSIVLKKLVRQPDRFTCGPASACMFLEFYKKHVDMDNIETAAGTKCIGTTTPQMLTSVIKNYVDVELSVGNMDSLKHIIAKNHPVIVLLRSSTETWHYVVVIGYDEKFIEFADPSGGEIKKLSLSVFEDAWSFKGNIRGEIMGYKCPICGIMGLAKCEICDTNKIIDPFPTLLHFAEVAPRMMIGVK